MNLFSFDEVTTSDPTPLPCAGSSGLIAIWIESTLVPFEKYFVRTIDNQKNMQCGFTQTQCYVALNSSLLLSITYLVYRVS